MTVTSTERQCLSDTVAFGFLQTAPFPPSYYSNLRYQRSLSRPTLPPTWPTSPASIPSLLAPQEPAVFLVSSVSDLWIERHCDRLHLTLYYKSVVTLGQVLSRKTEHQHFAFDILNVVVADVLVA